MRWSHNPSVHYGLQGKYCSQSRFLAYRALYSSTFHERRADGTPPNEVAGLPSTWTHYPSPDSARCTYLLLILSDLWYIQPHRYALGSPLHHDHYAGYALCPE